MSKDKVLVQWDSNWADEMDVSGFVIIVQKEATELKKKLREKKQAFELCIGTNEEIEYENGKELLDELTFTKLKPEEAATLEKHLGDCYGFTNFLDIDEDDEDDESEDEDYEITYEDD